jgi:hypothetical protein
MQVDWILMQFSMSSCWHPDAGSLTGRQQKQQTAADSRLGGAFALYSACVQGGGPKHFAAMMVELEQPVLV